MICEFLEICDGAQKKNASAKFGHVSGLFVYVYVIHNCLNFSRNSAKNLKILLKNSILCSKLKYSPSLMRYGQMQFKRRLIN